MTALLLPLAIPAFTLPHVRSKSILGFAAIGARSHQYCLLRIGQELAARGHHFTLLVSSLEGLSIQDLGSKSFAGLEVVAFDGPPGVGTTEWYEQLSRDLNTVCNRRRSVHATCLEISHALGVNEPDCVRLAQTFLQGLQKLQHEMISGALHLYSDKATMQRLHDAGTTASLHVQQLHDSYDASIRTSMGAF